MKGWADDDDPWDLHLKWSPSCPFARIASLEHQRDTQKPSWTESPEQNWGPANEWFPRGPVLIESRLATFCGPDGPWKHEGKKGIPTRLELARAGFHFTPNLFKKGRKFDVDDTTSCCYCHRSVTEWEVDDDPVSVHLKKGACVFFTATQPPEAPNKSGAKPHKRASKNPRVGPPNSMKAPTVDPIAIESTSDPEGTEKSSSHRRKPSSATCNAPKTGRRALASSTSAPTAPLDQPTAESESSILHKSSRASRKAVPAANVPPSPEPNEQSNSKPPVTLAKTSRPSRSASKPASTSASNRSAASNTTQRPRTRASSNASSTFDTLGRSTSNQTLERLNPPPSDEEDSVSKPKKLQRQKKPSKVNPPSSAVASDAEDYRPVKPVLRSRHVPSDEQDLSHVTSDDHSHVTEEFPARKIRLPGKTKAQLARSVRSEAHSPPAAQETASRSQTELVHHAESSNHPRGLSSTLFPGFNPQAPQLYPTLLPIAGKIINPSFAASKGKLRQMEGPIENFLKNPPATLPIVPEPEILLKQYLEQEPAPIPEGWLPNPYNPSRPFPPLTPEEAKMPLSEYFAYRAKQEEDEFLKWVEEKQMKPWLEAVERGRQVVEAMIELRKSQRTTSTDTIASRPVRQTLMEKSLNRANGRV